MVLGFNPFFTSAEGGRVKLAGTVERMTETPVNTSGLDLGGSGSVCRMIWTLAFGALNTRLTCLCDSTRHSRGLELMTGCLWSEVVELVVLDGSITLDGC